MANGMDNKRPWYKHWWGVLLMLLVLLFVFMIISFAWQAVGYYGKIKRGEISTADVAFLDAFTTTENLRQRFLNTPEVYVPILTNDDPQFGTADAPLIVVEFADFECPYSRDASFIIRELATQYADKILYIYRDFPLDEIHPNARLAAEAGECAQELGNFWSFHDKVYQNQGQISRDDLIQYATQVGLDQETFTSCIDSGKYATEVQEDYDDGYAAGVRGTPTFFLNGRRVEGAIPRDLFEEIIKAALL